MNTHHYYNKQTETLNEQEQLKQEKEWNLARLKLGNSLERLEKNKDFQILLNHFNEQINDLSYSWAIEPIKWKTRKLRAFLLFFDELDKIRKDKEYAEGQLKLLDEYELKREIEEEQL